MRGDKRGWESERGAERREKVQEKDREGDRQERQFPIKHIVIRIVILGMSLEAGNRREREREEMETVRVEGRREGETE